MILGIFPEQGGSISNLRRSGQDGRFIRSYLGNYAKEFDKVYYFSYADEDPQVPDNCYVIKNPGLHRWLYALALPFVQRRYVQECDIFRVMQMYGAIPAIVAKIIYHKPFVGTYGYRYSEIARLESTWLRAFLCEFRAYLGLKASDGVIVTTERLASYVTKFIPREKIIYIPNGVVTSLFSPCKSRGERREKIVVYVGRLSPEKNLFMLIDAIALIDAPKIKLVLIGDGELRDDLEDYAIQKNILFEFRGIIPHQELPSLLNYSDVFVLSSFTEGHPKVLLEAMSCGLPCVGMNVQGTRDVIRDGENGFLCQLTPGDLASKIALVMSDKELADRLGSNARKFVQRNFDLDMLLVREIRALKSIARKREQ